MNNHHSRQRGPARPDPHALHMTGFSVMAKPWSSVKAILSEFSQDTGILKMALAAGHGIIIDESIPGHDPMLYIVIDSDMQAKLKENKIDSPTILQMIGTSRCIGTSQKDAEDKFRAMLAEEN